MRLIPDHANGCADEDADRLSLAFSYTKLLADGHRHAFPAAFADFYPAASPYAHAHDLHRGGE